MNFKDKLPDFIDGLLDIEEEKLFFAKLASDDELLMEYKALNSIINNINSGINQFAPSETATSGVFSALGLNIPNEAEPKIARLNLIASNRAKKKVVRYSLAIAASIALLFSVSILNKNSQLLIIENANKQIAMAGNLYSPNKKVILQTKVNPISNKTESTVNNNTLVNIDYDVHSLSDIRSNDVESENNLPFTAHDIIDDVIATNMENTEIPDDAATVSLSKLDEQEILLLNLKNKSGISNSTIPDYSNFNEEQPYFDNLEGNESFTIELKNSIYFNPINKEKPNAKFNNIGLTILYQISDQFYAGIDLRDESFRTENKSSAPQTLSNGTDDLSKDKSSIDLTSIGIAVRYNLKDTGDNLFPSGQVILAKNREGIVGRLNVGISFKPFPGLTTTAGIEYSNMTYNSGFATHNSPKIGLNYGLAYNF